MKTLIALFAVACSAQPLARDIPSRAPTATRPHSSEPSLYDLTLSVTSAAGVRTGLDVDRGHPTLVSMFYGSCAAACPLLIDTIDRTLQSLPASARDDARVVLVSFDPARDTPARLRELVRQHRLDGRWTLAAASDVDARTLAAVLGIRYRSTPDGQFFHTSVIVALDRDGRSTARMDGIGDPSALVAALSE
ncbi:MAG TPA: SCO family protein [Kofleriaceae bacterium]|nr:SCO family protein [Kofleriaceae bacterium]